MKKENTVKEINTIEQMLVGAKIGFYICMAVSLILFTFSYGVVDWNSVSNNLKESSNNLLETATCEIDYKDFHYKGLCSDKEEIFNFIKPPSNNTRVWDCEEGCIYADWIRYGRTNRTKPSEMYNQCALKCRE